MDKILEFFSPKPKKVVVVEVVKEKPKRMSWDRALLVSEGAVGVGQGLSMLVKPSKAQVRSASLLLHATSIPSCTREATLAW